MKVQSDAWTEGAQRDVYPTDTAELNFLVEQNRPPQRPTNFWQALMEARPNEATLDDLVQLDELRDSVMNVWRRLTDEHQFVLGASIIEKQSYATIGAHMGVSKTQARRIAIAAKRKLEAYLLTEEAVRTHINYEKSWNVAVRKALLDLAPAGNEIDVQQEWVITSRLQSAKRDVQVMSNTETHVPHFKVSQAKVVGDLSEIGMAAAALLANRGKWDIGKLESLMVRKHRDYSSANIMSFGLHGVVIRMSDKVCRWEHLSQSGVPPENESLEDSLVDMVGYSAIALMLGRGEFELPLEPA